MTLPQIPNLKVEQVTDDILLVHQIKPPFHFSCSDGLILLPKKGRNTRTIVLDLNIEPNLIIELNNIYGPVKNYICSHGHMDHIAHVHQWETIGAEIFAPFPEHTYLLDLHNFYRGFGFIDAMEFSVIKEFAEKNGYRKCQNVSSFKPGHFFKFEELMIETIPFLGHSKSHVGLLIPKERVLHLSCLGFDILEHGKDGFGPWYGFSECSIEQYLKNISQAESIFLEHASFLTSSHAYIVKNPDNTPFTYMRKKITKNQDLVDFAINSHGITSKSEDTIKYLLNLDLFFPKRKMRGFLLDIYNFWESNIIHKHVERSKYLK